jgi:hypothetical protein
MGTRMRLILSWGTTLSQDPRLLEMCCSLYERERLFTLRFCLVLLSFFVAYLMTASPSFTTRLVLEAYDHLIVVTCFVRPIHRHWHVLHFWLISSLAYPIPVWRPTALGSDLPLDSIGYLMLNILLWFISPGFTPHTYILPFETPTPSQITTLFTPFISFFLGYSWLPC